MNKLLFAVACLATSQAFALSGNPNTFFDCPPGEVESVGAFQKTQCYVDQLPYVPPNGYWNHPVAFMHKPGNPKADIKFLITGWSNTPGNFCTGVDFAEDGYVIIKSCPGHFPDVNLHQSGGVPLVGHWGYFDGLSNSWRLGLAATRSLAYGGDLLGGVTLEGFSYGGTGVILQSMLLRRADPWWGNLVEAVHSFLGHTLFVENWPNEPGLDEAWAGANKNHADFRLQAQQGKLKNTYYRVSGSPADVVVNFDLDFFRYCDQYKIACFGTWHGNGHSLLEPGIDLPLLDRRPGPDSTVDIQDMLVAFTYSSANYWGPRGHFNLGLEWNRGPNYLDTVDQVEIPLRYRPKSNMGGGIPDQPSSVTVDVTIRRIKNLVTTPGTLLDWQFGAQSGQVTTTVAGEVTIPRLDIVGGQSYTALYIDKVP